jgi:RNA polymerase sigma factor (sigma-70 family)
MGPDDALLRLSSDERLVENVRAGSERAFEVIFERHHRGVLAFCRHMLGSPADAEDVVQHTFIAAYRDLVSTEKPIALRPWLYTIARNRCLSVLRARRERPSDTLPDHGVDSLAAEVAVREDVRSILTDVARLPDDQRAALILAELGDMSHAEIARILGCPRDRVKALVFQARASLTADRAARETPCADIREQLATVGGALRQTTLRRHVRACRGCSEFRLDLRARRGRLGLLMPVVALKRALLGALSGSGGAGAGGTALTAVALGGSGLATAIVVVASAGGGWTGSDAEADVAAPPRVAAAVQPSDRAGRVVSVASERAVRVRARGAPPERAPSSDRAEADEGERQHRTAAAVDVVASAEACCESSEPAPASGPADPSGAADPAGGEPPAPDPAVDEGADGDGRGGVNGESRARGHGPPADPGSGNRGQGPAKPPGHPGKPDKAADPVEPAPAPEESGKPEEPPEHSGPPAHAGPPADKGNGGDHGHKGAGKP